MKKTISISAKDKADKHPEKTIEDASGELVYFPPYSPDLNPIEKCWAKLKLKKISLDLKLLRRLIVIAYDQQL